MVIKETKIDNLCSYLDDLYDSPVLLKIYNSRENALSFANGNLCLGTIEYYRNKYEGDGRGDSYDSKVTYPSVINCGPKYANINCLTTYCLTCLIFCLVVYDHSAESKIKLKALFSRDKNLGNYVCIIKNNIEFISSLKNIMFLKRIEEDGVDEFIPKFKYSGSKLFTHGPVSYVKKPNDSGFQKRDDEKYICQQEYRFCFDFVTSDNVPAEDKGRLKGLFLYTVNKNIDCEIFELVSDYI